MNVVALVIVCGLPIESVAMLPVVDAGTIANLAKNFHQLKTQYDLLRRTYHNAQQQLDQVKQLSQDAEGHYGFGALLNGAQALKDQQWSPENWKNTLQGLSGGNSARYQELLRAYQHAHPTLSAVKYEKGASKALSAVYAQDIQVNRAAVVNATYAFDTIKAHLNKVHVLSQQIDSAQNTKAAMDLNTRLLTEIAYIQIQSLKMQILLNQQMAQLNTDSIAIKTASARFNTLPQ